MTKRLYDAAKAAVEDPSKLPDLAKVLEDMRQASDEEVQRAQRLYASDEMEIDDFAYTSESDEGVWVQGWVWLSKSEELT